MNFYNSNLDCTKTKWHKYIHFNQWRIQGERQRVGAPPPGNRESATVIVTFKKGNSSYLIFTDEKNLQTTVIKKMKSRVWSRISKWPYCYTRGEGRGLNYEIYNMVAFGSHLLLDIFSQGRRTHSLTSLFGCTQDLFIYLSFSQIDWFGLV